MTPNQFPLRYILLITNKKVTISFRLFCFQHRLLDDLFGPIYHRSVPTFPDILHLLRSLYNLSCLHYRQVVYVPAHEEPSHLLPGNHDADLHTHLFRYLQDADKGTEFSGLLGLTSHR